MSTPASVASVRARLSVPTLRFRDGGGLLYSTLARLVASGAAVHRADLVERAGLARSTVTRHLDALIEAGVVVEGGGVPRGGRGRPPQLLALNPRAGLVAVADIGARDARLAIADLSQNPLATAHIAVDLAQGPEAVLGQIEESLRALHASTSDGDAPLCAVAVGLPGPVDHAAGAPVRPPIMPGWDGYPVGDVLAERFGCVVLVDNDVNLMALGEARSLPEEQLPLLFVKVSTGIGGGLVSADGELHRGADGAAGDIGHLPVTSAGAAEMVCRCGKAGCVEAVASAAVMVRTLNAGRAAGSSALRSTGDLVGLVAHGDPEALRVVRAGAERIGEVVALLLHVYNPARVVLGGALAGAGDELLAGVRSVVYRQALPLATRRLVLEPSTLGEHAGRVGGTVLAVEHVLSPDGVMDLMERRLDRSTQAAPAS
ncbi:MULTISPECIES: ROK family protein [unclassified Streptomyces]|uniref:ROK family transcriptional regulator n=1 Tax=unclassified Streptomyces TaxID=2593676 RepID=UPI00278C5E5D|nr:MULTISPECIES: ROK family protein [unclassified Streptomyces]